MTFKYDDAGKDREALASVGNPRFYLGTYGFKSLTEYDKEIEKRIKAETKAQPKSNAKCTICHKRFHSGRSDAKYCSLTCKKRAQRRRYLSTFNEPKVGSGSHGVGSEKTRNIPQQFRGV